MPLLSIGNCVKTRAQLLTEVTMITNKNAHNIIRIGLAPKFHGHAVQLDLENQLVWPSGFCARNGPTIKEKITAGKHAWFLLSYRCATRWGWCWMNEIQITSIKTMQYDISQQESKYEVYKAFKRNFMT